VAEFSFEAIGTSWNVDVPEELSVERRAALLRRVGERIESFDRAYSRFREDSTVSAMARTTGTYRLPDDAGPMLRLYERLYRATGGAFTPLIGRTLEEAGYDAAYSLRPRELHAPPAWDDAVLIDADDSRLVTVKRPALLDFGAGGKGYLADLVGIEIEREGVRSYCVDAGGDVVYRGDRPLRVGLEDPRDATKAIGVATIAGGSICGSAGNRRAWGKFHHMIDPRTLTSPRHLLATWVIAESGLVADAVATALYFVEPSVLRDVCEFEYVVMHADGSVDRSRGAPVEMFRG
jgi:thiamine biosynthesis lipoprotein